jgi:stage II sporulation protein D
MLVTLSPSRLRQTRPAVRLGRGLALLLLTSLLAVLASPSASAVTTTVSVRAASALVVTGHGFGHGIGLSQWGAEERARAGQTYQQILGFYYPGTELKTVAGMDVRVWLASRPKLQVGSQAPFTVRDADGRVAKLAAGLRQIGIDGLPGLRLPLQVLPGSAPLQLGGTRYHGSFTLTADGAKLEVVNTLPLDDYVVDVVSSENPGYWPQDALRAQAVASRSFAVTSLRPDAGFDVYPDDRSQNYHGMLKEFASAAAAVAATSHQVLAYGGRTIKAYFSAANGGQTSGVEDVWNSPHVPYFVSRPDTFDAKSPDTNWGPVKLDMSRLRAEFPQLPALVSAIDVTRNDAGRVATLTFVGADGTRFDVGGYAFQQKLGLRSTYLSLTPSY